MCANFGFGALARVIVPMRMTVVATVRMIMIVMIVAMMMVVTGMS